MTARHRLFFTEDNIILSDYCFFVSPCGGDALDINQLSLAMPFYSVLVSASVFLAVSTVFHSINSPSCLLSHSVLPVLFLPYWFFQLYIPVLFFFWFFFGCVQKLWIAFKLWFEKKRLVV